MALLSPRPRCAIWLSALLLAALPATSSALTSSGGLDGLDESEREVLEAIASRPADRREAVLVATQHSNVLVRLELIQARSSAAFDARMSSLDREHQEEVWELVRTPGALRAVVSGGQKDAAELDALAGRHPEGVRDEIRHLGGEHFALLEEAEAIKAAADVEFSDEVAPLAEATRRAFEQLLEDPELLAMLARSPSAVVAIGDAYGLDPEATLARFDELAADIATANAAVEEEWRESLEDDPEARAELEQAARDYSDEYGYEYDDLTSERVEVSVRHYYTPYPYWLGYPRWYAHWYPWGWWYPVYPHVGYYHHGGHYRGHVYFGLPSLHFVHWFYGGHHYRYRQVARHFDHGRHGHHRSSHAVSRAVRRHERGARLGRRGNGPPDSIRGRTFRGHDRIDGRRLRGTRRADFRRVERMPDASFGRRFDVGRRRGEGRDPDRVRRRHGRRDRDGLDRRGRVVRVDRLPRSDSPRIDSPRMDRGRADDRHRDREDRARREQRRERRADRVARPKVSTPEVKRPEVRRDRSPRKRVGNRRSGARTESIGDFAKRRAVARSGPRNESIGDFAKRRAKFRAMTPPKTERGHSSGPKRSRAVSNRGRSSGDKAARAGGGRRGGGKSARSSGSGRRAGGKAAGHGGGGRGGGGHRGKGGGRR